MYFIITYGWSSNDSVRIGDRNWISEWSITWFCRTTQCSHGKASTCQLYRRISWSCQGRVRCREQNRPEIICGRVIRWTITHTKVTNAWAKKPINTCKSSPCQSSFRSIWPSTNVEILNRIKEKNTLHTSALIGLSFLLFVICILKNYCTLRRRCVDITQ